jgi:hypothetical protein
MNDDLLNTLAKLGIGNSKKKEEKSEKTEKSEKKEKKEKKNIEESSDESTDEETENLLDKDLDMKSLDELTKKIAQELGIF